jgi:hypothetical protein
MHIIYSNDMNFEVLQNMFDDKYTRMCESSNIQNPVQELGEDLEGKITQVWISQQFN